MDAVDPPVVQGRERDEVQVLELPEPEVGIKPGPAGLHQLTGTPTPAQCFRRGEVLHSRLRMDIRHNPTRRFPRRTDSFPRTDLLVINAIDRGPGTQVAVGGGSVCGDEGEKTAHGPARSCGGAPTRGPAEATSSPWSRPFITEVGFGRDHAVRWENPSSYSQSAKLLVGPRRAPGHVNAGRETFP